MKRNEEDRCAKTQNVKGKCPLHERLGTFLDIPSDLICGGCYMELRGQGELMLQGCKKIAVYTEEEIILMLRRGRVRIRGSGLCCIAYHACKIEIRGWISGIDFLNTGDSV